MDPISFLLQEVENTLELPERDFAAFKKIIDSHRERMLSAYPNYDLFTTGTGQSYGLKIEKRIIDSFRDISKKSNGSDYDAKSDSGKRIEIKSIKAIKGKSTDYIGARIVNLTPKTKLRIGSSFQQVKPTECDWFIFHILYGDAERLFLVPAKVFSTTPKKENREPGRILLSGQHRGHKTEGQVNAGQILLRASSFEIPGKYSSAKSNAYSFAELKKVIEKRLDALGPDWILPEK